MAWIQLTPERARIPGTSVWNCCKRQPCVSGMPSLYCKFGRVARSWFWGWPILAS